jgi:hypothetical protein
VRSAGRSEIAAKLLTNLGANFHAFSEQALILQGNPSDFDSVTRGFATVDEDGHYWFAVAL